MCRITSSAARPWRARPTGERQAHGLARSGGAGPVTTGAAVVVRLDQSVVTRMAVDQADRVPSPRRRSAARSRRPFGRPLGRRLRGDDQQRSLSRVILRPEARVSHSAPTSRAQQHRDRQGADAGWRDFSRSSRRPFPMRLVFDAPGTKISTRPGNSHPARVDIHMDDASRLLHHVPLLRYLAPRRPSGLHRSPAPGMGHEEPGGGRGGLPRDRAVGAAREHALPVGAALDG
jgi:hypothetical protein